MKLFSALSVAVCLLFPTFSAMGAEQSLQITEMAVTTKIVRGNPIDAVRRISSTSVKELYCFTRVVNPGGAVTTVRHAWYKDGVLMGEHRLPIRGARWRTWSKRPIDRTSVGDWRVDALDEEGNLLRAVTFKIN